MRLTLINQFFPPDLAPTGHMAASLAAHRAGLGDRVTVITSTGGYVPQADAAEAGQLSGLKMIRLWTPGLGKARRLNRLLDYAAFYLLTMLRMLLLPRQDAIISLTTPPFIAWAARLHKLLHPSTRLLLWNMDCYPEIAEQTGVVRPGGVLSRALRALNRRLFKHFDQVICLDDAMRTVLATTYASSPENPRFTVIPNWEPLSEFPPDLTPPPWEGALSCGADAPFTILYLGNAGFGHRFETVLAAANALRDEPFCFLFVGGGQQWAWLEAAVRAESLQNVMLHPYVPKALTPAVMASADCALITLRDEAVGLISPSKMHANLAMRLPLLYIGPQGSNVDAAIEQFGCGLSIRHGAADQVAAFLRTLREDAAERIAYRQRAREAFDAAFNDRVALPRFDALLAARSD